MNTSGWTFFQAFLKSPRIVASMIPSSPFLERRLARSAHLAAADTVVEIGCGTGGTTRALLSTMRDDSHLLAIERTAEFVATLRQIDDPRLTVVHGCASNLVDELKQHRLDAADVVISGIPFSTLPEELARLIVTEVHRALRVHGVFVAYQFSDRVADYAHPLFGRPGVELEMRNVPPLRVFTWEKSAASAAA
ncbi:MAG: methyltransferase domain-containing protein [Pseudomonadales bacterium]